MSAIHISPFFIPLEKLPVMNPVEVRSYNQNKSKSSKRIQNSTSPNLASRASFERQSQSSTQPKPRRRSREVAINDEHASTSAAQDATYLPLTYQSHEQWTSSQAALAELLAVDPALHDNFEEVMNSDPHALMYGKLDAQDFAQRPDSNSDYAK